MEFAAVSDAERQGFPAQNRISFLDEASGITTEILSSSFVDRHFVLISQNGKFGTMVSYDKNYAEYYITVIFMSLHVPDSGMGRNRPTGRQILFHEHTLGAP